MAKITLTLLSLLGSTSSYSQSIEVLIDRVAAVVDSDPILYSEIEEKISSGYPITVSSFPAQESDSLYLKSLQDTINFTLIHHKAKELEVEISEADVDAQIASSLAERDMSKDSLLSELEKVGMTYEQYKDGFRKQMEYRRFQGRVIRPAVKITDKDVETYFLKKSGTSKDNLRLNIRQIVIGVPEGAGPEIASGKSSLAGEVYQKLKSGMSFDDAVKIYSDGGKDGLMTGVKESDLAEVIQKPISKLDAGEFSAPIKIGNNFHIFLVVSRAFAETKEFAGQKQRLENELLLIESENQTQKWLADARQKAKIKIIDEKN